ncbi:MAG: hypothetical protein VZR13_04115 [Saccharofermentanaceae bacterium]|nr:hypothetical protein [Saccharofermentanaceae bacterium]
MKKALALVISVIFAIQTAGCSRTPSLDINTFEKYVFSDLGITKRETLDSSDGYYSLDDHSENVSSYPLDHYSQVYFSATNGTVGKLYMLYYDYQNESDARKFYNETADSEKEYVISNPNTYKSEAENDYIVVVSTKDELTYNFECLQIRKDIIIYSSIVLSASELERLDKDWLNKVDDLFDDLRLHSPFGLVPKIEDLI